LAAALTVACKDPWGYDPWGPGKPDQENQNPSKSEDDEGGNVVDEGDYGSGDVTGGVETGDLSGTYKVDASPDTPDMGNADIYWEANSFDSKVFVVYDGTSATVEGTNNKVLTYIDGANVTLDLLTNSVSGVEIVVRGTTTDGSLKIYGDKKHKLTLDGASIKSLKTAAINDQCHKRVFVHVVSGKTVNLTDCDTYYNESYYIDETTKADEDRKGAIFSEGNMIFSGAGKLVVKGLQKHGISSDGFIYFRPGINIETSSTVKNAVSAKGDSEDGYGIYMAGGNVKATSSASSGKGLKCELDVAVIGGHLEIQTSGEDAKGIVAGDSDVSTVGNVVIGSSTSSPEVYIATKDASYSSVVTKGGPGGGGGWGGGGGPGGGGWGEESNGNSPKAIKALGTVTVLNGDIYIFTAATGGEGIESKSAVANSIVLKGGNIYLQCKDDCINSAGQIVCSGANIYAYSTGNDAIDSNYGKTNSIVISGGVVIAHASSSPEEAFDADSHARVTINGGTVFTSGGLQGGGSSSSPSHSQPLASLNSYSLNSGFFTVTDSSGKVVMSCYVPRSLNQCYSFVSCPDFKSSTSYKYGVSSSAPSGYTASWLKYYYYGGTASVSTGTVKPS